MIPFWAILDTFVMLMYRVYQRLTHHITDLSRLPQTVHHTESITGVKSRNKHNMVRV